MPRMPRVSSKSLKHNSYFYLVCLVCWAIIITFLLIFSLVKTWAPESNSDTSITASLAPKNDSMHHDFLANKDPNSTAIAISVTTHKMCLQTSNENSCSKQQLWALPLTGTITSVIALVIGIAIFFREDRLNSRERLGGLKLCALLLSLCSCVEYIVLIVAVSGMQSFADKLGSEIVTLESGVAISWCALGLVGSLMCLVGTYIVKPPDKRQNSSTRHGAWYQWNS